jgi:RNA polymerase sigma-70 factor (ECF subfamily)
MLCVSRLGNSEDAADAVQETFMKAWRALDRGEEVTSPLPWLLTIADNVCASRLRARRSRVIETELVDHPARPIAQQTELVDALADALRALPARQRQAFLRRELQGFSYDEIAAELRLTRAAVTALLHRARRAVARSLDTRRHAQVLVLLPQFLRNLLEGPAPLTAAATTTAAAVLALPLLSPISPLRSPPSPQASAAPAVVSGHRRNPSRPTRAFTGSVTAATSRSVRLALPPRRMPAIALAPSTRVNGPQAPGPTPWRTDVAPSTDTAPVEQPASTPASSTPPPGTAPGISPEQEYGTPSPAADDQPTGPDGDDSPHEPSPSAEPGPGAPADGDDVSGVRASKARETASRSADPPSGAGEPRVRLGNSAAEPTGGNGPPDQPGSRGNGPPEHANGKGPPEQPGSRGNGPPEQAQGNGSPEEPGAGGNGPPEDAQENGPPGDPGSQGNGLPEHASDNGQPGSTDSSSDSSPAGNPVPGAQSNNAKPPAG